MAGPLLDLVEHRGRLRAGARADKGLDEVGVPRQDAGSSRPRRWSRAYASRIASAAATGSPRSMWTRPLMA
ncbi:hypothetical protein GCM10020218_102280 [Dactylosporangium vinaceum]